MEILPKNCRPSTACASQSASTGKVVIPARFVNADRFRGGYAVAMEEGALLCEDGRPRRRGNPCEHPHWNGPSVLIDRSGVVVARPFVLRRNASPDWSRAKVVETEPDTTPRAENSSSCALPPTTKSSNCSDLPPLYAPPLSLHPRPSTPRYAKSELRLRSVLVLS